MDTDCNIFKTPNNRDTYTLWFKDNAIEITQEDVNKLYGLLSFHQTVVTPLRKVGQQ